LIKNDFLTVYTYFFINQSTFVLITIRAVSFVGIFIMPLNLIPNGQS